MRSGWPITYIRATFSMLDTEESDYEAEFICALCGVLGDNDTCAHCGTHACEQCLAACCPKLPLPLCALCGARAPGFWTCAQCPKHVCRRCAPTDKTPPGFYTRERCRACARRVADELRLLEPVLGRLPEHLGAVVRRAVAQA